MRVLILHQFYTRLSEPGIARFSLFAKEWERQGVDMYVIASSRNYATGEKRSLTHGLFSRERDESGVMILRTASWTFGLNYWSFVGRMSAYLTFTVNAFLAALFAPRPDVIIASAPPIFLGLVGWAAAKLRRVPFIYETRDIWPDEAIALGVLKNPVLIRLSYWLERFIYRGAKRIVVNSPGVKTFLVEKKRVPPQNIGVIVNPARVEAAPLNSNDFRQIIEWTDKFVVLYSGAHAFVYDFDTLLDAAKLLKDDPEILFVLVGGGRYKERVVARIADEGLKNVKAMPAVPNDEVGKLLGAADLCVAALRKMEFLKHIYASKLLSYMAAGKPILLAMEGVSADLVREAKAGVVVAPGDAAAFAAAVVDMKKNQRARKTYGESGQAFVKEFADSARLANEYLDLLQPLVIANSPRK